MKLTIKNLKVMESLSEETLCYSATVYVDGVKAFYAENRGHGGEDFYHADGKKGAELLEKAEAWAKTLPPYDCGDGHTLSMSLELHLGSVIAQMQEDKWLKRQCAKKTLFTTPEGGEGQYRQVMSPYSPKVKAYILGKYPNATIVNERFL